VIEVFPQKKPIRILFLEDEVSDAELNEAELRRAGVSFTSLRVETRPDFARALEEFHPDVIVADYRLPQFSAMEALDLVRDRKGDLPFILVTGSQSEEVAVDSLKEGADDYILKQSLKRLPSALQRALEKREAERRKEDAERQLRKSNQELRALSAHLVSVREEERGRIAREIHDELGQALTALRLDLAWLEKKYSTAAAPPAAPIREQLTEMAELLDSTIQTVKKISTELRPRILDELGLLPALEWLTDEFRHRTGIRSSFSASRDEVGLAQPEATAIFRIVQESLTNVARHSGATEVRVHLEASDENLMLTIEDNGRGMTAKDRAKIHSFGILGMKERAQLLGGNIDISSAPGRGTIISLVLPLQSVRRQ
jgi:signal transduction histidine kinase